MQSLLLAAATPALYIFCKSNPISEKLSTGYQIWVSLLISFLWALIVNLSISSAPFLTFIGLEFTVDNYGGTLSGLALIFVLYIGPLLQTAFIEEDAAEFNLPELKSFVTDALCEEVFLRVVLINCLLEAEMGFNGSVFMACVIFTAIECKHFFTGLTLQNMIKHQQTGEIVSFIGFSISFAMVLSYVYVRTGSLCACFLMHVFKNFMGYPDIKVFYDKEHALYSKKWIIAAGYTVGLVGFVYLFQLIMMNQELFTTWTKTLAT